MNSTGKHRNLSRHVVAAAYSALVGLGSVSAFADVSLNATGADGKVALSWTTSDTLRAVQVMRDTDADPAGRQHVAILAGKTRSFTDSTVTSGKQYCYWIKCTATNDAAGNSASTSVVARLA